MKANRLFAIVFIFFICLILVGVSYAINEDISFYEENGTETTAVITDIIRGSDNEVSSVYVTYQANGLTHNSILNFYSSGMYEGMNIQITYLNSNPLDIIYHPGLRIVSYILLGINIFLYAIIIIIIGYRGKKYEEYYR